MTEPLNKPDIRKKLQDAILEALREKGLADDEVVWFMGEHGRIVEEFLRKTDEKRAGYCPKCGHSWAEHDTEIKGAGSTMRPEYNPNGYEDLYECIHYAGMGDWCGCEERSRRPVLTPPETTNA